MIKADFYPTQDTWTLDNKSVELTAFLNTMEYTSDIGQQYVMGYVPYDYVPTFGRLSHIHREDTEGAAYIEFTDAIDQDNYGWTLTADTGKQNHSEMQVELGISKELVVVLLLLLFIIIPVLLIKWKLLLRTVVLKIFV